MFDRIALLNRDESVLRAIEAVPRTPIAAAAAGLVRITGRVESKKLLKSPITARSCVYHEVVRADGTSSEGTSFLVRDSSGVARVTANTALLVGGRTEFQLKGRSSGAETVLRVGDAVSIVGVAGFEVASGETSSDYRSIAARTLVLRDGDEPLLMATRGVSFGDAFRS